MGKTKPKKPPPKKKSSPPRVVVSPISNKLAPTDSQILPTNDAKVDPASIDQAITVISDPDPVSIEESPKSDLTPQAAKVAQVTDLASKIITMNSLAGSSATSTAKAAKVADPVVQIKKSTPQSDSWLDLVKGQAKGLEKKGESFILPSGEACVKIPNEVIERNRKSWDCFVLGQFYSDAPAIGTLHKIANGIWSKQYRDITVSKMEGNAFLFRIPNISTRVRVINQRLWSFEGQTMFVAKWEPGVIPAKPELTSAPIWLELRNVPLQFFHEEGLERIAGLVGDPKFLHPSTANKTNLEVAKVFTIIDPRKPLPEAVNVQFDSGEIKRVDVSSPWMPPICSHCKEVGHSINRCSSAPITCVACNSTSHGSDRCPRATPLVNKKKARLERKKQAMPSVFASKGGEWIPKASKVVPSAPLGKGLGTDSVLFGESSSVSSAGKLVAVTPMKQLMKEYVGKGKETLSDKDSEVEDDSSDVCSDDSEEEGELREDDADFTLVVSKRQARLARGRSPNHL